ncbi:Probably inactive leucine-rich repeat receptor-like protein kinase At5g48380 [Linum grandiflorum]
MGLKGQFPLGLKNCTSITGLDLSSNELSGPLPTNISQFIGFVTSLDLSSNAFSGEIPVNLANCSYLNVLNLDHNRLTGSIPGEISNLNRIKTFNVANNLLTGPSDDEDRKPMEWSVRLKIAIRAAKGFAWLHHNCNPRILHRNISSKCIMLDAKFEPRISDFGLARLMNPIDTHLSTFVNGEFGDLGYVEGDVYSFGIVLLELVTSEKPTQVSRAPEDFRGNLVEWVKLLSSKSQLHDAMDKSLLGKGADSEVFQVLKVACNCVGEAQKERPSMFEVYQLLRAIGEKYQFTAEDEMMMPTDDGDADFMEELIVARDGIESS